MRQGFELSSLWISGPAPGLNAEEGIHFQWHLLHRGRGDLKVGAAATGVIRLERTTIAAGAGDNRVQTELVTDMFLGDRRENLFKLGALRLRCYGKTVDGGASWLELPPDDLWIFPAPRT